MTYKRENIIKKIITILITVLIIVFNSYSSYATDFGDANIKNGSINIYGDIDCKNREETQNLEAILKSNNFICVSGKDKEITDEEFNLLFSQNVIPYNTYASIDNTTFQYEMDKIYVFRPYYNKVMELAKSGTSVSAEQGLNLKIYNSTVLIDYGKWYAQDRNGKIVNEYNDNIPIWDKNSMAYIQVTSPTDAILEFEDTSFHSINQLPIKCGENTFRMVCDGYKVTQINNTDIDNGENTLPYNNNIQLTKDNTEDNPYIIDLTATINKNNIPITNNAINNAINNTNNNDENNDENSNDGDTNNTNTDKKDIDVYKTKIKSNDDNNIENNNSFIHFISQIPITTWIMIIVFIIISIIIIIYFKHREKLK